MKRKEEREESDLGIVGKLVEGEEAALISLLDVRVCLGKKYGENKRNPEQHISSITRLEHLKY